jgi:hypothetical protein
LDIFYVLGTVLFVLNFCPAGTVLFWTFFTH